MRMQNNLIKKWYYTKKEDETILAYAKNSSSFGIIEALRNASKALRRPFSSVVSRYYKTIRPSIGRTFIEKTEKKVVQKSEKVTTSSSIVIPTEIIKSPVAQKTKITITFNSDHIIIEL